MKYHKIYEGTVGFKLNDLYFDKIKDAHNYLVTTYPDYTVENKFFQCDLSNYSGGRNIKVFKEFFKKHNIIIERVEKYTSVLLGAPTFKDYEYGWYGFHSSYQNNFMNIGYCHKDGKDRYTDSRKGTIKQLPKLKNVVFIYGDYKESI